MSNKQLASYVAEGVGTFILASVAMVVGGLSGLIIVGLTLMVLVSVFGGISGAHVNPAVTAGMLALRKISLNDALGYVVAQGLGALVAWQLHEYLTDTEILSSSTDFSGQVFTAEIIGMAIFGMGIAAAVHNKLKGMQAAATIGFSLMLGLVVASAAGAGIINPAVALGLRELSTETLLGPLIGSVAGMTVYVWLATTATSRK